MIQQTSEAHDELLGRVANEFFEAAARGERPSIDEYARRYPELADDIRRVFPALAVVGDSTAGGAAGRLTFDQTGLMQLGDFRILHELGRGGMGTVFEAEQISMGRRVALKVLPFAALAEDKALKRFRNEVRAAAALDHPHIVSVYSGGEERGIHYYSMQLIRGRTLADVIWQMRKKRSCGIEKQGSTAEAQQSSRAGEPQKVDDPIPPRLHFSTVPQARFSTAAETRLGREHYRVAARLGIQAADALQHAHELGVLHRDIKPGNLMLDAEGKLYITDFGLARIEADAGVTMTGDLVGTLRYMAPEQALAKRVVIDHRADIYSLGATLYELLTLQPAFGESDRSELLKQIAFEEPTPLRKLDPHIPAELETIVLKSIAKNPAERYQTAQLLADDLQAYLDHRPIQAKPPTIVNRVAKWSRRHRAIVASTLVSTAAVAAISLVLLAANNVIIKRERDEKVASLQRVERSYEKALDDIGQFSNLDSREERLDQEEHAYRDAVRMHRDAVALRPSEPAAREHLLKANARLGKLLASRHKWNDAEKALREAVQIGAQLTREFPDIAPLQQFSEEVRLELGCVLHRLGKVDEANETLSVAVRTMQTTIPKFLAKYYVANNQYREAAEQFAIDARENPQDHDPVFHAAVLYLAAGDRARYEAMCDLMFQQFGPGTNPIGARRTCYACCIAAKPYGDIKELLRLSQIVIDDGVFPPSAARERSMVEYRAGNWQAAREWAIKSRKTDPRNLQISKSICLMVEAMAAHRLGDSAEAASRFQEAVTFANSSSVAGSFAAGYKLEWIGYQQLRAEAESLLGIEATTKQP